MRFISCSHRGPTRAAVLVLGLASMALVGCPKQEDFPAALDLVVPPTPTNFVISNPSGTTYDFAWEVSDPSQVDVYRLYLLGGGFGPDELLLETPTPSHTQTFGFSVTGLQFAVSAVNVEGVEGYRDAETAP